MRYSGILAVLGAFALLACSGSPLVGARWGAVAFADGNKAAHDKSRYGHKRGARVKGFLLYRGGYYSYVDADVIKYGSTNTYRDFLTDRQTQGGPFDSGFFFDSGMGPRWNDSPYPR
jgi:hypothetical protein